MFPIREISAEEYDDHQPVASSIRDVVRSCNDADGVATLNEQTTLMLRNHGLAEARLWVASSDESVVGFALVHGEALDLAVHPDHRRQGLGSALASAALTDLARVEAWSHADHPGAARLAARFGIPRARELKIMSRATSEPLPAPDAPAGIEIRAFRDADLEGLLAVNAAAFSHHPEQGSMSSTDFRERADQAWFDPDGLFVALRDGTLVGFHWTKVEGAVGEVYVVAVSPAEAGRGLGRTLTNVGLAHLAASGVDEVILYVDGNNEPAIAVYSGLGFHLARTEAQYRGTPRV